MEKSVNWFFICFSIFRIFHVDMTSFEILLSKNFLSIWLNKWKIVGRFRPSHPRPGLHPWTPHAFGLRTLASLIHVWIRFAKISHVFCVHEVTCIKIDHISKSKSCTRKIHKLKIIYRAMSTFPVNLATFK